MDPVNPASSPGEPPAVVCTLTTKELVAQTLEWSDLAALKLSGDRIENGVVSTYPIDLAAMIEDLAQREIACCGSWLSISTERLDDVVRLEVTTTNPDGLETIASLAGLSD